MPSLKLRSESSLVVQKDVLSIRMFIYKISKNDQKSAILAVSSACNYFINHVKSSKAGEFAKIVKSPLASGMKKKSVKNEKNGRTEYETVFEGYEACIGVSVDIHFKDITENNLKLEDIYLFGTINKNSECTFIPNYEFIVSDELMKESRKKLRTKLMTDSMETAMDIVGSSANSLSAESISYGVDGNSNNYLYDCSKKAKASAETEFNEDSQLDFESINLLISGENVEPVKITDSIIVTWEFK